VRGTLQGKWCKSREFSTVARAVSSGFIGNELFEA